MPELPEVEVCRQGVRGGVLGKRIREVVLRTPALRHPLPASLAEALTGTVVVEVRRRGKYLLFDCERDGRLSGTLLVHLGMTGVLRFVAPGTLVVRHEHVDLVFDGRVLRYSDPRRFGLMLWHAGEGVAAHPLLQHLGVEPLEAGFDGNWLHAALAGRRAAVQRMGEKSLPEPSAARALV